MAFEVEDLRQSDEWSRYICRLGWGVEKVGEAKVFIRKLPLIGSVGKIQRPSVIPPVEEIDRIAKEHRVLFIKLEPSLQQFNNFSSLRSERFAFSESNTIQQFESDNWPLLPSRTIWVDLQPDEDKIFANFSKDARYSIRKTQKVGVAVVCKAWPFLDLHIFYELFRETGSRKQFWVPPEANLKAKVEAFKNKSALILAYHNEEPVAGALILFHDRVAYYHHAASNLRGRKLLAPYLIVWEAIKLSKKRGCHTLDLEGIFDPRYKIYRRFRKIGIFKSKFGGKEIEYPGSFIRYYNPIIKLVFEVSSWVR